MKIYKNSASMTLSLEEFLELLEQDAIDEIFAVLMDLDETGSISDGQGISYTYYMVDPEDMDELLGEIDDEDFYIVDDDDLDAIFGQNPFETHYLDMAGMESLTEELLLSNEDLRVRRIVNRFQHIID